MQKIEEHVYHLKVDIHKGSLWLHSMLEASYAFINESLDQQFHVSWLFVIYVEGK